MPTQTPEDAVADDIASRVDAATAVPALRTAAQHIDEMVLRLHAQATPVERIAQQVGRLNSRIFARLWGLLAPADLVAASCLLVMGSEGRGEQILKTDQDNALLLRDGFACPGLEAIAQDFNAALAELGYPRCPGDIMLTNPLWRQPLAAFRETMRGWLYGKGLGAAGGDGPMHLAIFFDAAAVAGDASLLDEARAHLAAIFNGNDAFLARFAAAADQFHEPRGWFTWLRARRDEQALDLKKLGTFPIVHGVRALSLQYAVREPGTAARLQRLAALGRLPAKSADGLTHALHVLMALRLTHQLHQRARGELPDNEVRPSALDPSEREPLRDALAVVKNFRLFLRQHYRLDAL
jgi:CBS domain-containing protein